MLLRLADRVVLLGRDGQKEIIPASELSDHKDNIFS